MHSVLSFNGERTDPHSTAFAPGNGYRTYNASLMRFVSPDSWSPFKAGEINAYTYCTDDPINRGDPSGHHSILGWLGIATGVVLGVLFTPVSGGSLLAVTLSVVSVIAAVESTALAIAQQFVEASNPKIAADLGWASLGFGLVSAVSSAALYRMASRPRTLFAALRNSLFEKGPQINLHPKNAAPVQFYKAAGMEPEYTEGRISSTLTLGFTSDFTGSGEAGLVSHTDKANRMLLDFGKVTVRNGTEVTTAANRHTVESLVDYFRERNIDLRAFSRDKPLHLAACCAGGDDGAAQRLADVLERPVISYGNRDIVYSHGLYPLGNGRATNESGAQFAPVRYEPARASTPVQLSP